MTLIRQKWRVIVWGLSPYCLAVWSLLDRRQNKYNNHHQAHEQQPIHLINEGPLHLLITPDID